MTLVARAWPTIVDECRAVLGGELHYQAVVYHCLRGVGVPRAQLGMNVKQWITDPVSPLFQTWDARKAERYRGGFEPIPDVVLFAPGIQGDWRRRNFEASLRHMLVAIEVKASERAAGRLSVREITRDIDKLAAHRDEAQHRGCTMHPVMMVIDTAPVASERMTEAAIRAASSTAEDHLVSFFYASPTDSIWQRAD
jgi:hypothetical protein